MICKQNNRFRTRWSVAGKILLDFLAQHSVALLILICIFLLENYINKTHSELLFYLWIEKETTKTKNSVCSKESLPNSIKSFSWKKKKCNLFVLNSHFYLSFCFTRFVCTCAIALLICMGYEFIYINILLVFRVGTTRWKWICAVHSSIWVRR